MRLRTAATAGAVALTTVLALGGCGGSSTSASASPATLLRQAKATLDASSAVHFVLATNGAQGGGLSLVGGEGDLGRPDSLKGTFQVKVAGVPASIKVASAGGTFLAQLPFSSSYQRADPSSFGFADPAKLISPNGGLSSILVDVQSPHSTGQTRVGGEVLDQVSGTVPGSALTALPDDDPAKPVQVQAGIDPSNHQLRRISLTGPIGTTGQATYTVTLTAYGERVDLALPPT